MLGGGGGDSGAILLWLTEILRWPPVHPVRTHWNLDDWLHAYSPLQHRWTPNITVSETAPCEKWSKSGAVTSGRWNGGRLPPCHSTSDRQNPIGLSLSALNGDISYKQSRQIHQHTHTKSRPPPQFTHTNRPQAQKCCVKVETETPWISPLSFCPAWSCATPDRLCVLLKKCDPLLLYPSSTCYFLGRIKRHNYTLQADGEITGNRAKVKHLDECFNEHLAWQQDAEACNEC